MRVARESARQTPAIFSARTADRSLRWKPTGSLSTARATRCSTTIAYHRRFSDSSGRPFSQLPLSSHWNEVHSPSRQI